MSRYSQWKPYVPVAERRRQAGKKMSKLKSKGIDVQPIEITGRKIAHTFWGKAWCDHLESYSDFANRLPRGRTYVRNGSVCHLAINRGSVEAKVSGSELYNIKIDIKTLPDKKWKQLKKNCAGRIGSLLGLLQGELSGELMGAVTDRDQGLFPDPKEISLDCSCPDWADMCKHVAAALYGVGARLDDQPELLFLLRGVDHEELIDTGADAVLLEANSTVDSNKLAGDDLSDIFGIDLVPDDEPKPAVPAKRKSRPRKKTPARMKTETKEEKPKKTTRSKTVVTPGKKKKAPKKKTVAKPKKKAASKPARKPRKK
jgi:uncharacterized Zn finger protein